MKPKMILFIFYTSIVLFAGYTIGRWNSSPEVNSANNERPSKLKKTAIETNIKPLGAETKSVSNKSEHKSIAADLKSHHVKKKEKKILELFASAKELERNTATNLNEIVTNYEEIISMDDKNEQALSSLANVLISSSEYSAALKVVRKCLRYHPKNELCNGNLTNVFIFQSKLKEAKEAIDECLKNTPDNSLCHSNLASYYMQSNDSMKAVKQYKMMLEGNLKSSISMQRPYLIYQLAVAYGSSGKHKEYVRYLNEACDEGEPMACSEIEQL